MFCLKKNTSANIALAPSRWVTIADHSPRAHH